MTVDTNWHITIEGNMGGWKYTAENGTWRATGGHKHPYGTKRGATRAAKRHVREVMRMRAMDEERYEFDYDGR